MKTKKAKNHVRKHNKKVKSGNKNRTRKDTKSERQFTCVGINEKKSKKFINKTKTKEKDSRNAEIIKITYKSKQYEKVKKDIEKELKKVKKKSNEKILFSLSLRSIATKKDKRYKSGKKKERIDKNSFLLKLDKRNIKKLLSMEINDIEKHIIDVLSKYLAKNFSLTSHKITLSIIKVKK